MEREHECDFNHKGQKLEKDKIIGICKILLHFKDKFSMFGFLWQETNLDLLGLN